MRNNHSLRIGATWIAMAGLGAAAALLLAPQAGSRTRRQIQRTARRYWGSMARQLEGAQDLLNKGRSTADVAARQLAANSNWSPGPLSPPAISWYFLGLYSGGPPISGIF
jgi:hypothetical protein